MQRLQRLLHHVSLDDVRGLSVTPCANTRDQNQGDVTVLFYAYEMKEVAQGIAAQSPDVVLGDIQWRHFADGFPNIRLERAWKLKRVNAVFLASFHNTAVIFEQLNMIYSLPTLGVGSFKVIVPWFCTGTMERVVEYGEVATAATLARLLSIIPHCARGPARVSILDIHALGTRHYFTDNVQVHLASCVSLLLSELASWDLSNVSIAFPDDGAAQRFASRFTEFPVVICQKIRDGDRRIVSIKEGDAKGRHCIIVDDLVQSGGTLLQCQKALKEQGAAEVSCYVTHAVFPNQSWKKFLNAGFHKFFVTNSLPNVTRNLKDREPFHVLSIVPKLVKIITDASDPEDAY